jgi:hypothetical protein
MESESIQMNVHCAHCSPLVCLAGWVVLLPVHNFVTVISHLENTGFVGFVDLPNLDTFHYDNF